MARRLPDDYVMRPFVIRLAFQGRHWLSVGQIQRWMHGRVMVGEW
jgi:hypothetical protein